MDAFPQSLSNQKIMKLYCLKYTLHELRKPFIVGQYNGCLPRWTMSSKSVQRSPLDRLSESNHVILDKILHAESFHIQMILKTTNTSV